MKYILSIIVIVVSSTFISGQNNNTSNFTEKEIESGSIYKKYKNGKLDSIIVSMYAVNYANALLFSKSDNEILITNASDENSVIKIQLKNKKQIKTFIYKDKPLIVIENINFDINHLPKNTLVSSGIYNQQITSCTVTENFKSLDNDYPDKTIKLFYGLNIPPNLDNLNAIFENIGDFFSEEDALSKIFYGSYAEKFAPQVLAYLKTDDSEKITEGIIFNFKNKKINEENKYNIYKKGEITTSGIANLNDFQKIYMNYREKSNDFD